MWIVKLIKPPKVNDFRDGFFPRQCHYQVDAQKLVDEVAAKGGVAEIARSK